MTPTGRMRTLVLSIAACLPLTGFADTIKVDVIKNPYGGGRNVPELSTNPDYIHAAGIERLIEGWAANSFDPFRTFA